jgi:prepilin-type N-terminal cleavage/methylation domain-containing protein
MTHPHQHPGLYARRHAAFTLVELLAVIVVLAVLSAVAIPSFLDLRFRSAATAVAADFRVIAGAANSYFQSTGTWPSDGRDAMPAELDRYFSHAQLSGGVGTPMGADTIYDWNGPPLVSATGTLFDGPNFSVYPWSGRWVTPRDWTDEEIAILRRVDSMIDDGDIDAGRLRNNLAYLFNLP